MPTNIDAWGVLPTNISDFARDAAWLTVVTRLRDGVTLEQAQQEMDAVAARLREVHPFHKTQNLHIRVNVTAVVSFGAVIHRCCEDLIEKPLVDEHPGGHQLGRPRFHLVDHAVLFRAQDDAECADDRHSVGCGTTSSCTVVEHDPPRANKTVGDHLRLARTQVPMFDAGRHGDVRHAA
jgi:hypothetical protein